MSRRLYIVSSPEFDSAISLPKLATVESRPALKYMRPTIYQFVGSLVPLSLEDITDSKYPSMFEIVEVYPYSYDVEEVKIGEDMCTNTIILRGFARRVDRSSPDNHLYEASVEINPGAELVGQGSINLN